MFIYAPHGVVQMLHGFAVGAEMRVDRHTEIGVVRRLEVGDAAGGDSERATYCQEVISTYKPIPILIVSHITYPNILTL